MAYDERLAERIREVFRERIDITERKMFGGLAFLCLGRMCCGIVGGDLVVRIPHDECDAVMRNRHVRPMDFTGKPLKGFVYVSPSGFRTRAALVGWLSRGQRVATAKAAELASDVRGRARRPRSAALPRPKARRTKE